MLKWDGHTHSKYCRHGSGAEEREYIERALEQGFKRYTVSEHPPLPDRWVDNDKLMAELAMPASELKFYLDYAHQVKREYEDRLEVTVGLEMDYLHGRTEFSDAIIDSFGSRMEDAVVSVHYLPGRGGMRCIDFTPDDFRSGLLEHYGAMEPLVEEYYDQVELAIEWAAKLPFRKRIGHINLIEKFRTELPAISEDQIRRRLEWIVPKLRDAGVGLDVNTAGLRVKTCGKPYVPEWFLSLCLAEGVECVFGSDAHKPEHAGYGWSWYEQMVAGG